MRIVIYKLFENEEVLYNLGILLEQLFNKKTIGVFCDENIIDFLDKKFWTFSTNSFLPHDIADGTENDEKQPILLSSDALKIDREIICVFNNKDLDKITSYIQEKKLKKVKDIIYMTQEDLKIEEIRKKDSSIDIDYFEKNNGKWIKK